MKHNNNINNY